jgi:hypothetical protein
MSDRKYCSHIFLVDSYEFITCIHKIQHLNPAAYIHYMEENKDSYESFDELTNISASLNNKEALISEVLIAHSYDSIEEECRCQSEQQYHEVMTLKKWAQHVSEIIVYTID